MFVVLPPEGDRVAVEAPQTPIRDGDPMGVATQIIEHVFGAAKGWFRVDNPLGLDGGRELSGERSRVTRRLELAMEAQRAGIERIAQLVEKEPREDPYGLFRNKHAL
jgi:hypothetical protein